MTEGRVAAITAWLEHREGSLSVLLLISGFIGAVWGLATATYQTPIEAAQVMNGLVKYAPTSPVYTMHISLFTGVNYFLSAALALTNSEIAASAALGVVIGIVAMQSLAMAVFVGVRNVYLAVIAAVVAVPIHLFGYGIAYPIIFFGTGHANGRIGLFFAVLAILFFAFSRFRTGFFLCGLTLLVHPSWGIFVGVCIAVVLATGYRYLKPLVNRANLAAYFAGVGISVATFILHKILFPLQRESGVNALAARRLFSNYITNWDYHRQRFANPDNLIRELTYAAVALVVAVILLRRRTSTLGEKLFAHFLIVATLVGVVFVFIPSWFSPDAFPEALIVLMPGRFVNIALFLALPMVVGLLLNDRKSIRSLAAVAVVWAVLMFLSKANPLPIGEREFSLILTAVIFAGLHAWNLNRSAGTEARYGTTNLFLAGAVLFLLGYSPFFLRRELPTMKQAFAHVSVPPVQGTVLTTYENFMLQGKARVPTITPLLDGFPHTGSGTLLTVQREMKDIYGVDLAENPPRARHLHEGVINNKDYHDLWVARSCEEWTRLAGQYQIGLIITPPTFTLRLPRADQDPVWNKYYPRCPA